MKQPLSILLLLAAAVAIGATLSVGIGAVAIAPLRVLQIVVGSETYAGHATDETIVWQLRLPRVLLACCIGAGLGASGAGYQGLFRNPLVDPFVIGASSGAALGATLAMVAGATGSLLSSAVIPTAALVGALLAVAVVYSIASVGRETPVVSLLLTGVAVSSFLGALVSLLMFLHDEQIATIFGWLMGSLAGKGWQTLAGVAPLVALGFGGLWLQARALDALTFGDEGAAALGVRMPRLRGAVGLAASLMTAACVAATGIIGFVGLIAPHAARRLVGPRHAALMPASALVGALLLLIADNLARMIAAPSELPVGIVTALFGGPFFLFVLKSRLAPLRVA